MSEQKKNRKKTRVNTKKELERGRLINRLRVYDKARDYANRYFFLFLATRELQVAITRITNRRSRIILRTHTSTYVYNN